MIHLIVFLLQMSASKSNVYPDDNELTQDQQRTLSQKSCEDLVDGYVRAKGITLPKWRTFCKVSYSGNHNITEDHELELQHIQTAPTITWPHKITTLYVLTFLHLYNPFEIQTAFHQRVLWLVGNLPGNNISAGDTLIKYSPPIEPRDREGPDAFMFMVYKQNSYKYYKETFHRSTDPRKIFLIESFAEYYDLGHSIHGNFFRLKWHENSPSRAPSYEDYSEYSEENKSGNSTCPGSGYTKLSSR